MKVKKNHKNLETIQLNETEIKEIFENYKYIYTHI